MSVDYLAFDEVLSQLQAEADHMAGYATPVKLVITDRDLPSDTSDGFTVLIKFDPQSEQAAHLLEEIVSRLYSENNRGVFKFSYRAYPDYACSLIDMDKLLIRFPHRGEQGGTTFNVYKEAVSEDIKQKVAQTVGRKFHARCSILEGRSHGFLIETLPHGDRIYQLASACRCTVKEVLRRLRLGWTLTAPTVEAIERYTDRLYFFMRFEITERTVKVCQIGTRFPVTVERDSRCIRPESHFHHVWRNEGRPRCGIMAGIVWRVVA